MLVTIPRFSIRIELWSFGQHEREKAWTGAGDRPILAASMPVRAIQKKWAALRAVLFPWEIGGYMAAGGSDRRHRGRSGLGAGYRRGCPGGRKNLRRAARREWLVQRPPQLPAGIRRGAARGVVCLLLQFTSVSDSQNMPHDRAKKSANREPQVPSRKFGAFYAQE